MDILLKTGRENAQRILSVLKTVASANGMVELHDIHIRTLQAIARQIFSTDLDIGTLPTHVMGEPDDIPSNLRPDVLRMAGILPMLEDEHKIERASALRLLSDAWKLERSFVKSVERLAHDHTLHIVLHALRVSRVELGASVPAQTLGVVKAKLKIDGNPDVLAQFERYQSYPEGTVGKTMFQYFDDNEFDLPGTPGNYFSNNLIVHDLHHVLSGYDTSPLGELAVQAFDDGISRVNYASALVAIVAQFQLAVAIDPSIPTWIEQFDPEIMFAAKRRGLNCTENYLDGDYNFDPLMREPLSDVRKRFNISEEGMLVRSRDDKWCGPLGPPYSRQDKNLISRETLRI